MIESNKLIIISGGQTGVDRAALDFALKNKIICSGWCPHGRLAEDGKIPKIYPLTEIPKGGYPERTRKNIEESDGNLIIYKKNLDTGTQFTKEYCYELQKPFYIFRIGKSTNIEKFYKWLEANSIIKLNIAGPRESSEPGIYKETIILLERLLRSKG